LQETKWHFGDEIYADYIFHDDHFNISTIYTRSRQYFGWKLQKL